jgi:hypothetical protein
MAIDTSEKRRNVGGNMPTPDGTISTLDRRQVAGNYRGMPFAISFSGSITPTGSLSTVATHILSLSGEITPTGALTKGLFLSFGGSITPVGSIINHAIFIINVGGSITPSGGVGLSNPSWIPIDDRLRWLGEWDATKLYAVGDVVMYKTTQGNYHGFLSRTTHNIGNIPTESYAHWARIVQARWSK